MCLGCNSSSGMHSGMCNVKLGQLYAYCGLPLPVVLLTWEVELNCRKLQKLQSAVQEHMGQWLLVGSCWVTFRYVGLAATGDSSLFAQLLSKCAPISSCLKLSYWAHYPHSISSRKPVKGISQLLYNFSRDGLECIKL